MDWSKFRSQFPVIKNWAFLDHAAVAPLPGPAQDAMIEYVNDMAQNGVAVESKWVRHVEKVRELSSKLINCDPLDVAFVKNTSEGIAHVADGLPWQAGDNLIISNEEYPANVYPWLNLERDGVEVRQVAGKDGRILIDDIRGLIDEKTRLISLSFVEYASGFRNDLMKIGGLCREHDILFFVDAIQGLGVLPVNVQSMPIDFLSADGHKWLLGPNGAGMFYVRRELIDVLRPMGLGWNSVVDAWNFSDINFTLKPNAGRYESGSMNEVGIAGLGAALEMLLGIGINEIENRVMDLTDHLCEILKQRGINVYSSRLQDEKSGIVVFDPPNGDSKLWAAKCREAGVIVANRAGRLRASPHYYNTVEELDLLCDVVRTH